MPFADRIAESPVARAVLSAVVGIGLATLFRSTCKGGRCFVVQGPPVRDVEGHVYRLDGSCYRYSPVPAACE